MNISKHDFPIFTTHPDLVYLDNASTVHKPTQVLDAMRRYYEREYANVHRGVYALSEASEHMLDQSKKAIANLIGADKNEIIYTSGATGAYNLLAQTLYASNTLKG